MLLYWYCHIGYGIDLESIHLAEYLGTLEISLVLSLANTISLLLGCCAPDWREQFLADEEQDDDITLVAVRVS